MCLVLGDHYKETNTIENETNTTLETKKEQLTQITAEYQAATQAYAKEYTSANSSNKASHPNKQEILQKLQTIGALDTQKITLETEIAHLEQTMAQEKNTTATQTKLTTDPCFIANSPGNRTINPAQYTRLSNTIGSYHIDFKEKNRLINEILFDCRFGSLVKNNTTNQEMPLERSINIALKLVREKR